MPQGIIAFAGTPSQVTELPSCRRLEDRVRELAAAAALEALPEWRSASGPMAMDRFRG